MVVSGRCSVDVEDSSFVTAELQKKILSFASFPQFACNVTHRASTVQLQASCPSWKGHVGGEVKENDKNIVGQPVT